MIVNICIVNICIVNICIVNICIGNIVSINNIITIFVIHTKRLPIHVV